MTSKKTIQFVPADKVCVFSKEESVLEVALRNSVDISHSCGGMGTCGTCRIVVEKPTADLLPERNEIEQDMAVARGFSPEERLSCQLAPIPGLVVRIPARTDTDEG